MKTLQAVFAALISLLVLAPFAFASAPSTANGSFTGTVVITSVRQTDGNTIITAIETQTLTGLLSGTRVAVGVEVVHPDGTFNAHDTGTFVGTVNGRSGTAVITGSASGLGNVGSGQLVVEQGTAGLAGLHAQGTFQPTVTGPTTTAGTYSVQFHFEP